MDNLDSTPRHRNRNGMSAELQEELHLTQARLAEEEREAQQNFEEECEARLEEAENRARAAMISLAKVYEDLNKRRQDESARRRA